MKKILAILLAVRLTASSLFCLELERPEISILKSLVDPLAITQIVQTNYPFNEPVHCTILSIGINDMYLIEVGGEKYVFRLSRVEKCLTMTEEEFQFELEWLEFLNQHQVPVAYPIHRLDHQLCGLIQTPEGPRYTVLFSYAKGTTDLNVEQAFILGKALAQLHLVSDDFETELDRVHLDLNQLIDSPLQQIKDFFGDSYEKKYAFLDELANELRKQIEALDVRQFSYGIIAGDLHGGNQHFTEKNRVTMFDFEFCAYGYRIYDIATFRWSRGADKEELWHAFLDGYQSIRSLSDSEIQAIDVFVKARNFWWMGLLLSLPEHRCALGDKFWKRALARFDPN